MTTSKSEIIVLCREAEAEAAARRVARRMRAPQHVIEDIRQDLLVDLIRRMPAFDPERGCLGAFAGTILRNRATRVLVAARRQDALFGRVPVSLDEGVPGTDGLTRGDLVREEDGYGALFGQRTNMITDTERRIAVAQGVGTLDLRDRRLCASLMEAGVDQLAKAGVCARSSLYRRVKEIRLNLTAIGLGEGTP